MMMMKLIMPKMVLSIKDDVITKRPKSKLSKQRRRKI